MIALG